MTRGINHVEDILSAVDTPRQTHSLRLNGNTALALNVHTVEVLGTHGAIIDNARELKHPVGQRGLPVVDVGNDGEIADERWIS